MLFSVRCYPWAKGEKGDEVKAKSRRLMILSGCRFFISLQAPIHFENHYSITIASLYRLSSSPPPSFGEDHKLRVW
jgi:hypothetical protein